MIKYEPISRKYLDGVVGLCQIEGWASYTEDPELTWKALTAPGVCTVVARDGEKVLGFAQMQSDGHVQAHLSLILVARDRRRKGIGARLVREALKRSGGKRVDLLTDEADEFYRSFRHQAFRGYRIYPHLPTPGSASDRSSD